MRNWVVHFGLAFAAAFVTGCLATWLWSWAVHGQGVVNWPLVVALATALGAAVPTAEHLRKRRTV